MSRFDWFLVDEVYPPFSKWLAGVGAFEGGRLEQEDGRSVVWLTRGDMRVASIVLPRAVQSRELPGLHETDAVMRILVAVAKAATTTETGFVLDDRANGRKDRIDPWGMEVVVNDATAAVFLSVYHRGEELSPEAYADRRRDLELAASLLRIEVQHGGYVVTKDSLVRFMESYHRNDVHFTNRDFRLGSLRLTRAVPMICRRKHAPARDTEAMGQ